MAVKSDNEVFIPSLSRILLAVCNYLKHTVYVYVSNHSSLCSPSMGPSISNAKKRKGRKTALKWRRIPFRGKFFLRRQAAQGAGAGAQRARVICERGGAHAFSSHFSLQLKFPVWSFILVAFTAALNSKCTLGQNEKITLV